MLRNPKHWQSYYHGEADAIRLDLTYAYSDRCRYYWNDPSVQEELARLTANVAARPIPHPLISQYLPAEYDAIRAGELKPLPEQMIEYHIQQVLRVYAAACSVGK